MSYPQAFPKQLRLQVFKDGRKLDVKHECETKKRILSEIDIRGQDLGLLDSFRLCVKKEKFFRYSHNLNLEKARIYYEKVKSQMLEMLDESMEDNDGLVLFVEGNTNPGVSENEGCVIAIGECMKSFDKYAVNILKMIEVLK